MADSMNDPLRSQAQEVLALLANHLTAWQDRMTADERRSIRMAKHRLERGLNGEDGIDPARAAADWMAD